MEPKISEVSLKELFEVRVSAIEKATELAAENLKVRLEGLNEWRLQNRDERSLFISRPEHELVLLAIQDLKESRAELRGRASQSSVYIAYLLSTIGIIMGILELVGAKNGT